MDSLCFGFLKERISNWTVLILRDYLLVDYLFISLLFALFLCGQLYEFQLIFSLILLGCVVVGEKGCASSFACEIPVSFLALTVLFVAVPFLRAFAFSFFSVDGFAQGDQLLLFLDDGQVDLFDLFGLARL
jgi:hypothetical protein